MRLRSPRWKPIGKIILTVHRELPGAADAVTTAGCSCRAGRHGFTRTARKSVKPTIALAPRPAGKLSGPQRERENGSGTIAPTGRVSGGPGGRTARFALT